jgi:hypothetical protein
MLHAGAISRTSVRKSPDIQHLSCASKFISEILQSPFRQAFVPAKPSSAHVLPAFIMRAGRPSPFARLACSAEELDRNLKPARQPGLLHPLQLTSDGRLAHVLRNYN